MWNFRAIRHTQQLSLMLRTIDQVNQRKKVQEEALRFVEWI